MGGGGQHVEALPASRKTMVDHRTARGGAAEGLAKAGSRRSNCLWELRAWGRGKNGEEGRSPAPPKEQAIGLISEQPFHTSAHTDALLLLSGAFQACWSPSISSGKPPGGPQLPRG